MSDIDYIKKGIIRTRLYLSNPNLSSKQKAREMSKLNSLYSELEKKAGKAHALRIHKEINSRLDRVGDKT